jgi:hypothetical protein
MLFAHLSQVYAEEGSPPSQKEFEPPSGKGRVVIVVSGQTGPVVSYPATNYITNADAFVAKINVPTLIFAGSAIPTRIAV